MVAASNATTRFDFPILKAKLPVYSTVNCVEKKSISFNVLKDVLLRLNGSPYERSIIGEYGRLLLLLVGFPLLFWFGSSGSNDRTWGIALVATAVLLGSLLTARGSIWLRVVLLASMSLNVLSMAINSYEEVAGRIVNPAGTPVYILLICLLIATSFELASLINTSSRTVLVKNLGWSLLLIPAVIYVAGVPFFELLSEAILSSERESMARDPDWGVWNEISFRGAKFGVFAVFTCAGACLGSFLNVVAHSVPRGKAIGLRDSTCPCCNSKISRFDNIPIFSYINLGARCRNCQCAIPIRYLLVELVVAAIFGSLFLYELVTGAANIPFIGALHQGILWVILYPKWSVIGVYFFHALFMSVIVVLSLIEWDKQPLRVSFAAILGFSFLVPAAGCSWVQPVSVVEHLSFISIPITPWLDQLLRPLVGAVVGVAVGYLVGTVYAKERSSIISFAFFWQVLLLVGKPWLRLH